MTDSTTNALDERYGRTQQRHIDRRLAWIIISLMLALGLAVLIFGNWRSNNQLEFRDLAYSVVDDRTAEIDFELSVAPGESVTCALEALSPSFGQVGWKIVEIEPGEDRTRRFSQTLVTTVPATTALVRNCWID